MTLQEALTAIKSAIYGEDVRNAIVSGLQLCYSERASGGYASVEDADEFQNGIAVGTSSTVHRPYDAPFLLYSAGNENLRCQVAVDPDGTRTNSVRKFEDNAWTAWASMAEDSMFYIHYWNQNGTSLLYTERVSEGRSGYWNGIPSKSSTAQYDYIFTGWNEYPNQTMSTEGVVSNVRSNKEVYAAFSPVLRSYTVRFYNGSTPLTSQSVTYGSNASYTGDDPTKESTAQYSYRFIGWNTDASATEADSNALKNITSDRNVYAIYAADVRSYNVTFKNGSDTLQTSTVAYGGTAVYNGATPTKPSTPQYDYNFVGWNTEDDAEAADPNATKNIIGDRILYAVFSSGILTYTVRFMNGAQTLETLSVEYGNDATYSGSNPTKAADAQYTYTFAGWNTSPTATTTDANATKNITSDRDIYAVYNQTLRTYTVTFKNGNNTLDTETVPYGSDATYHGSAPVKTSSAQYNYNFVGWNTQSGQSSADANALKNITANRTVYAAFSATVRSYTVRFIDGGTVLQTKSVSYGNDVAYAGTEPSKADTAQYDYTFVGWNSAPNQTTHDASVLQNITANRDIYAAYSATIKSYDVKFYYNSELLYTDTVQYGSTATYSGSAPTKPATAEYHYNFVGWNQLENQESADPNALTNITGPRTVYAAFEEVSNEVTVIFYNGSVQLSSVTVRYGSNVTYSGATPTKDATVYYTYEFVGWNTQQDQTTAESGILNNVVRNLTVYAAFSQTAVQYSVTFYNGSTEIKTQTTTYGGNITYSGSTPTKAADAQYTYTFAGWNADRNASVADANALRNITASKSVYAIYSKTVNEYTVRFMNGTTVLESVSVPYGSDAVYTGETPAHPTEPDAYEFIGWDPDGTNVVRNIDCQPVWTLIARDTRNIIMRTISGNYENSIATSVDAYAFDHCQYLEQASFVNATRVGQYAFAECINLSKVYLPKVTVIQGGAFPNCQNLRTLVVGLDNSTICTLQASNAFLNASANLSIYVPDNLVARYKTTNNWSFFANKISGSSYIPNE